MVQRLAIVAILAGGCGSDPPPANNPPPGPQCTAARPEASGEATYYDATGAGNCSFEPSPGDLMVAAMNGVDYAGAAWCGGCVEVTGPLGKVVVRIVDQCPGCAKGDLDLSREAFAMIADLSAGRVQMTWNEVACPVTGPIAFHHKDGTNEFYTAIQVLNHRYPIATLETREDAASAWEPIPRVTYNYFIPDGGLGTGPYALRTTDTRGHVLEDLAVAFRGESTVEQGAAQFPSCP